MSDLAEATGRPMRSHARRNRERILAVARDAMTSQDDEISLNEVARRAGVGIGTLFRHFASREALLEALVHDRTAALCVEADRLLEADAPGAALVTWLSDLVEHVATYRGVAAALLSGAHDEQSALHRSCQGVDDAAAALLARAQQAGEIRADIGIDEVISLVSAVAWVREQARERAGQLDTLMSVIAAGLRSSGVIAS
ncbi:TetR/AcrR family transcriptional regulator [Protofrankia symbiont of Coriaria ruscifolia]|nr:TetR/AcrR family transcriptional regulator [Protofrankia symbiont of Coriaria ruscifolia]